MKPNRSLNKTGDTPHTTRNQALPTDMGKGKGKGIGKKTAAVGGQCNMTRGLPSAPELLSLAFEDWCFAICGCSREVGGKSVCRGEREKTVGVYDCGLWLW